MLSSMLARSGIGAVRFMFVDLFEQFIPLTTAAMVDFLIRLVRLLPLQ